MTEHPLITPYIYGVCGWMTVHMFLITVARHRFQVFLDAEARRLEVTPRTVLTVLTIMYTVGWPITALLILAYAIKNRGGRD